MNTESAAHGIPGKEMVRSRGPARAGWLTAPGIGVALLPKLACPLCWPMYSAIVSSVGLGFLISAKYLMPLTIAFMILTLGALAWHAKQRRGYGPFVMGIAGAVTILIAKFGLESNPITFTGIAVLVAASAWNIWPLPDAHSRR